MKVKKKRVEVGTLKAGKSFVLSGEFYTVMADGENGPRTRENGDIIAYGHRDCRGLALSPNTLVRRVKLELREV